MEVRALPGASRPSHIAGMPDIDDKKCPLCGNANGCQAGDPACWCNFESVPSGLRELVPVDLVMKSCICRACVLAWKADEAGFRSRRSTTRSV